MDDTSLCDDIINYHTKNNHLWCDGTISKNNERHFVDVGIKDSKDLPLNSDRELLSAYMQHLNAVTEQYFNKYEYAYPSQLSDLEQTNIQYYNPGGGYKSWHCERGSDIYPNAVRHLVFLTYLNDVSDSGETEFFYQKIKVKPEKGLTLIWPTDWMFTHRGIVSPSQKKWIVTGWLHFTSERVLQNTLNSMGIL